MSDAKFDGSIKDKIPLTPEILDDINLFSRLNLRKERCSSVTCFSDPVRKSFVCNPDIPDDDGKVGAARAGEKLCAIYWICHCYFASRLGLGSKETAGDSKKSLSFAKTLSWPELCSAIDSSLRGEEVDTDKALKESKADEQAAAKAVVTPIRKNLAKKKATAKASKARGRRKASVSEKLLSAANKLEMKKGSMGYEILCYLDKEGKSNIEGIRQHILSKGWKKITQIDELIPMAVQSSVVFEEDGSYRL